MSWRIITSTSCLRDEKRDGSLILMITVRFLKMSVVTAITLFFWLIVFNNITDFETNHWFVKTVLSMEGVQAKEVLWRSIHSPLIVKCVYVSIIIVELQ